MFVGRVCVGVCGARPARFVGVLLPALSSSRAACPVFLGVGVLLSVLDSPQGRQSAVWGWRGEVRLFGWLWLRVPSWGWCAGVPGLVGQFWM